MAYFRPFPFSARPQARATAKTLKRWRRVIFLLAALIGSPHSAFAVSNAQDAPLLNFAVHINHTPKQGWPGYGVYLGNGYVLTAAHVTAPFAATKPVVVIGKSEFPATLVREGAFDHVDLTLMSIDQTHLPLRVRMRRLSLCAASPKPGEYVVVATPEGTARSRVLPVAALPVDVRGRFGTTIGDVATTGNSGSGVFDAGQQCLLGIVSRKISMRVLRNGVPVRQVDIAKYFVPAAEIKAFLPPGVTF